MKTYTVRFRCKARLDDEESTTESDYELQLEAENLEDVYTRLDDYLCLLYTSPSPRDSCASRMPSSA